MDAMVSARVPAEIKKHGDRMLKEMGSSTTELINAAYAYLLEYGTLPAVGDRALRQSPETKTLSGVDADAFTRFWEGQSVLEAPDYDGGNFKELLSQARQERHARFA